MKSTGHRSRTTLTCARNLQFESTNNIKQNEKSIPVAYTSVWNESAGNERGEIRRVENDANFVRVGRFSTEADLCIF